jgi:hypothetical protein
VAPSDRLEVANILFLSNLGFFQETGISQVNGNQRPRNRLINEIGMLPALPSFVRQKAAYLPLGWDEPVLFMGNTAGVSGRPAAMERAILKKSIDCN